MAGRENSGPKQFKTEIVKGPGQTLKEKHCVSYSLTAAVRKNLLVNAESIDR